MLEWDSNMTKVFMTMWTIYDHPTDFPDYYVAREYKISVDNTHGPTDNFIKALDLDLLRAKMHIKGLTPLARDPSDDPKIIETWI